MCSKIHTSNGKSRVEKLVNATENPCRPQGVNGHKPQWSIACKEINKRSNPKEFLFKHIF